MHGAIGQDDQLSLAELVGELLLCDEAQVEVDPRIAVGACEEVCGGGGISRRPLDLLERAVPLWLP